MAILNGIQRDIEAASYATDVGQWRHVAGNWTFGTDGGGQTTYTIYTVTGNVLMCVAGLCQTLLDSAGAPTIELGITGNTAALIAQTTAKDLDADETWQDAVPEANPGIIDLFGGSRQFVVANGADVILTVATADLTAGVVDFHAFWMPLSSNGNVAAV